MRYLTNIDFYHPRVAQKAQPHYIGLCHCAELNYGNNATRSAPSYIIVIM